MNEEVVINLIELNKLKSKCLQREKRGKKTYPKESKGSLRTSTQCRGEATY